MMLGTKSGLAVIDQTSKMALEAGYGGYHVWKLSPSSSLAFMRINDKAKAWGGSSMVQLICLAHSVASLRSTCQNSAFLAAAS